MGSYLKGKQAQDGLKDLDPSEKPEECYLGEFVKSAANLLLFSLTQSRSCCYICERNSVDPSFMRVTLWSSAKLAVTGCSG